MDVIDTKEFVGDFLEHFGVKGMRWGHRKAEGSSSAGGSSTKEHESEDHAQAAALNARVKSGGTKVLSNKELRDLVNRMNLEQQFSKINTPAAKKKNPILVGTVWTAKKMATLTGQSVEQVIKANLANEMNQQVKARLNTASRAA